MIPVHSIAPPLLVEKSNDTSNYKMTKALSQFSRTGWTPGRKAKQAQVIQRWKPWQRSTGPKSADGKAKVARNAFKGGNRPALRQSIAILKQCFKDNEDFLGELN
jgi:hypothetical protein